MRNNIGRSLLPGLVVALAACRGDLTGSLTSALPQLEADESPQFSDWSVPVNVGAPVNSASLEQGASLSRDGLSLYFASTRPGGFGGADIYVSRRACPDVDVAACAWQTAVNLGPTVNTGADESATSVSTDGHRLFFTSNRPGGLGGQDLYVSRRRDRRDDLAWQAPVNLGPGINTGGDEGQPDPFEDDATGISLLYYAVGPGGVDIYVSTLGPDGTYGPGVPEPSLNTTAIERMPAIGRDGLEILFASDRPGTFGALDLWVATRSSTLAPWSTPVNLGSVVNTTVIDARPAISFDGTQLYLQSPRSGGLGSFDLYVTTRAKVKGPE